MAKHSGTPLDWLERWRTNLKMIRQDIGYLLFRRTMFDEVNRMVKANPRLLRPNTFFDWMAGNYIAATAAGIRRHDDSDSRSVSLHNLIAEMIAQPQVVTRQEHLRLYSEAGAPEDVGNSEFSGWANGNGDYLDTGDLQNDLARLKAACASVRKFVNKRIAHLSPEKVTTNFGDLKQAMITLEELALKYTLILLAQGGEVEPSNIDPWQEIFTFPWIEQAMS